jgi:hypothetical protein
MFGWFLWYFAVTVRHSPGASALHFLAQLPPESIILKKRLHAPARTLNHNAIFNYFIRISYRKRYMMSILLPRRLWSYLRRVRNVCSGLNETWNITDCTDSSGTWCIFFSFEYWNECLQSPGRQDLLKEYTDVLATSLRHDQHRRSRSLHGTACFARTAGFKLNDPVCASETAHVHSSTRARCGAPHQRQM